MHASKVKIGNNDYFRIILRKKWTGSGEKSRVFPTREEAKTYIKEQEENRFALREGQLSSDEVFAAKRAFARLRPIDVSLEDVIEFYFSDGPGGREPIKLSAALEAHLKNRRDAGRDESYIDAQRIALQVLQKTMGDRHLSHYSPKKLDEWLKKSKKERNWSNVSQLNYYRDLKLFFGFAARQGMIPKNPMVDPIFDWVEGLKQKIKEEREVSVYTPEEAGKLLRTAMENPHLGLLGWLVTAFFGGPRVAELKKLRWSDFRDDDKQLVLGKKTVAKGGDPRHIPYSPTFEAWLAVVPRGDGLLVDPTNLRNRLDELFKKANVQKKKNALRHTFASNHYVEHGDAEKTRRFLGHDDDESLFKHYVELLEKKQAKAFWDLRPPTDVIIAMPSPRGRPRKAKI